MPPSLHAIPDELRACPRWINWRVEMRQDKLTKVPMIPGTYRHASSTNPETWRTFAVASKHSKQLGFVLGDGILGIDLDHAFEPDGTLRPRFCPLLDLLPDAYWEFSPSHDGVHILARGSLAQGRRHDYADGSGIEIYGDGRYFTMTGDVYERHTGQPLPDVTPRIDTILHEYFPASSPGTQVAPGTKPWSSMDLTLTETAQPPISKFKLLSRTKPEFEHTWDLKRKFGTPSEYDQSLADMAAQFGWTAQEICDLLLAFRRDHDMDLKTANVQYYQRTIWKALEYAQRNQALDDLHMAESASPTESLATINHLTGLDLTRYVQTGKDPASYRVYLAGGEIYQLGSAAKARSQAVWQSVAQEQLGTPFKRLTTQQWHQFLICLGHIVEREEVDNAYSTVEQEFRSLLWLYARGARQEADASCITDGFPFCEHGVLHLHVDHFSHWAKMQRSVLGHAEIRSLLQRLGAQQTAIHRRDGSGAQVFRRYSAVHLTPPTDD
jgi:hypothetical protein